MKKFTITHYQKENSMFRVNGGTLLITNDKYIIKYWFHTVAEFEIAKTRVTDIPRHWLDKGILFSDGNKKIELYFFPKTAEMVYNLLTNNKP